MTSQEHKPAEAALASAKAAAAALNAAGRELAASLKHTMGEIGPRLVATTALGQVFAGLPDAASGMLAHLPPDQLYEVIDAVNTLHEIAADLTPEAIAATEAHQNTTPDEAQAYNDAGLFLDAWHQRRDLGPKLGNRNTGQLIKMRGAAVTLIAAIDQQIRQSS